MKLSPDAEKLFRLQDYSQLPGIEGVQGVELKRFGDDTGSMIELARLSKGRAADVEGFQVAQVNYSTLDPGAIKAFHVHRWQTDVWFVPPEDKILVVLVDVRKGSATEGNRIRVVLGNGDAELLVIPPGVAHGCRNLGATTARILYFADQQFSAEPDKTDEGRLPWDFAGADIWEPSRD